MELSKIFSSKIDDRNWTLTSWMNIEHTGLILPTHFVTSLTINGAEIFIRFNPKMEKDDQSLKAE